MYTITFYSFKGGVGRTMALVNVGAELARRGRKVLLVDFDLEAPGLETFERLRPPRPHPGLVEYVTKYLRTKQLPDVREYVYRAVAVGKKGGEVWVMPAGRRDANYQAALHNLNWKSLYRDCEGFLFFEYTKQQWEQEFHVDYVLIDSRTGHTDVEGICTRQLPDAVAVFFFPNDQNLVGLKGVCSRIREEKAAGLKKEIPLHFVMSNVPDLDDEDRVLRRRLQEFRDQVGISKPPAVIHHYDSLRLLDQAIFVLDRPRSRLAREYRHLGRELIRPNHLADRDAALDWLQDHSSLYLPDVTGTEVSPAGTFEQLNRALDQLRVQSQLKKLINQFLSDAEMLVRIAEFQTLVGQISSAHRLLDWALQVCPGFPPALLARAVCKKREGDAASAAEDLLLYLHTQEVSSKQAFRVLEELSEIAPGRLAEGARQVALKANNPGWYEAPASSRKRVGEVRPVVLRDVNVSWRGALARLLLDNAESDEGVELAIDVLSEDQAAKSEPGSSFDDPWTLCLMRAGRWREVINRLEPALNDTDLSIIIDLAMAYWGETGSLPESLCRCAMEIDQDLLESDSPGAAALMLWRLGDSANALRILEESAARVRQTGVREFSYWRYHLVTAEKYLEDCRLLQRMIEGEPLRPTFLGEPAAPSA